MKPTPLPFTEMSFAELESIEVEARDESWEKAFLARLPEQQVKLIAPEPREGPDHWPYLLVSTGEGADEPFMNVLAWLSTRGIGAAVNPQKPAPDYVITFGMIWNFRERGEFLTPATSVRSGRFDLQHGQELLAGPPTEQFLPVYVRSILKRFFADQGVFTPKVQMISADRTNFDLCFSIESLKSPPAHEHANIAEAVSWFLPAHYSVGLVSEKVVPGFQAL